MKTLTTHKRKILTLLGMGLALVLMVACASQAPSPAGNAEASNNPAVAPVSGTVTTGNSTTMTERDGTGFVTSLASDNGQMTGISVSGQGLVHGTPDLATINLGVEASRDTVQAARDDAAAAMNQIIAELRQQGIEDRDIQTIFFSIHQRYDREGQNVIGFTVSNQVTVKVRDLGSVGTIIDEVTAAGGDATRFQGISFSIENTKPLEEQARAAAVADLTAKANQLADLTGVRLGSLVSITETGGVTPLSVPMAERAFFDQAAAPTPILAGQVDVMVTLQAVFAIEQAPEQEPTQPGQ